MLSIHAANGGLSVEICAMTEVSSKQQVHKQSHADKHFWSTLECKLKKYASIVTCLYKADDEACSRGKRFHKSCAALAAVMCLRLTNTVLRNQPEGGDQRREQQTGITNS